MEHIGKSLKQMNTRLIWGSSRCYEHDKYPEGVQTMVYDGVEQCPMCECARMSEQVRQEEQAKATAWQVKQNYYTFKNSSVLQDKTLLDARFDNYLTDGEPEAQQNLELMQQYANDILNGQVFNILLYGTPGVGKSHLSYALLYFVNEAEPQNRKCLFIDIDEMLRLMRDFKNAENPYTEQYFTKLLSEVDVLVLDDLGAETGNEQTDKRASDFTGRILRAVTNARQDKVTIITTNLPGSQLERMYDSKTLSRLSKKRRPIIFKHTSDKRKLDLGF